MLDYMLVHEATRAERCAVDPGGKQQSREEVGKVGEAEVEADGGHVKMR